MPVTLLLALSIMPSLAGSAEPVRIGLFRLFAPETVRVRVVAGGQASIHAGGATFSEAARISDAETLRLVCKGDRVDLAVSNSAGSSVGSLRSGVIAIIPRGGAVLEVSIPGKISRRIRDELLVSADADSAGGRPRIRLVVATGLESAVRSIVAAELKGNPEEEARKALEVACRSYMLAHRGRHSREGFDFCDTTHCQLYQGDISAAAQMPATRGEVLSFEHRVVEGYYTAVCGGRTRPPGAVWGGEEASGYPYREVACSWCRGSAHWRWRRSADAARVFEAVSKVIDFRLTDAAEVALKRENSSTQAIEVRDGGRRFRLSAERFRRAIGRSLGWNTVLSPSFTVQRRGRLLVFEGRGFGSQVGLCVAGARAQAAAGRGYREVLSYYYPGAEIREGATSLDR